MSVSTISSTRNSFQVDYKGVTSVKGPSKNRSCTDLYCFAVFIGFIVGWLLVANYAYWNGDIGRLYSPSDSEGRICGQDITVKDKPYLLFFDISQCVSFSVLLFGCPTKQICVSECPKELWFSDNLFDTQVHDWHAERKKLICVSQHVTDSINSLEDLKRAIVNEKCAPYYIPSIEVGHICLPTLVRTVNGSLCIGNSKGDRPGQLCLPDLTRKDFPPPMHLEVVEDGYKSVQTYFYTFYEVVQMVREDLMRCWPTITLLIFSSVISCLLFITALSFLARLMVWLVFLIIISLLCYSTFAVYAKYQSFQNTSTLPEEEHLPRYNYQMQQHQEVVKAPNTGFWLYDNLKELTKNKEFWLTLTIICAFLVISFLLLILFLRSRINLAILIIREGSRAINDMKSTLLFPVIPLTLKFAVIAWFAFIFGYLKTLGDSVYTVQGMEEDLDCTCSKVKYKEHMWCLPYKFREHCHSALDGVNSTCRIANCVYIEPRTSSFIFYLQAYNFFGLLWGIYFVAGFGRLVLSYCFAHWYWTFNKRDVPFFMLTCSICVSIRYHLGTVAVGSFLISTLSFIRSVVEYLHRNLKKYDNLIAQCMYWSLKWCFWLLQKFLTFISENAYTMCAIYGEGFWRSAQSAVNLLLRNIVRVIVLDKVVDFLILMGKFGLTYLMTVVAYYTFQSSSLHYVWVPTAVVGLITWIVASTFFNVYTVAVDTLFLCFLKDGEINDGSQEKPYYMSHNLKYVLNKKLRYNKHKVAPNL